MVAPYAPTLLTPANRASLASVASGGFTVMGQHSEPGTNLTKFAIRRRLLPSGSYEYWTGSAWGALTYVNLSANIKSGEIAALPVSMTGTNGQVYQWSVSLQDANVLNSPFAPDRIVKFETTPTVSVVAPVAGNQATSRPLVSWNYSDANGYTMLKYRAKLFNDLQYGAGGFDPATSAALWDSGDVYDPLAYKVYPAYDIVAGRSYRTYVKVTNIVGQDSAWDDSPTYNLNTDLPPAPTLTLTPKPDLGVMEVESKAAFNLLLVHQSAPTASFNGAGPDGFVSGWEALMNCVLSIVDDPATGLTGEVLKIQSTGGDLAYIDSANTDLAAEDTAYTDLANEATAQET